MLVHVRDNNVDQALRALKKKMQREGVFREMKLRNFYEKPSEKRSREKAKLVVVSRSFCAKERNAKVSCHTDQAAPNLLLAPECELC